eukprot:364372-Chlamydomonas_euryale.AAC.12
MLTRPCATTQRCGLRHPLHTLPTLPVPDAHPLFHPSRARQSHAAKPYLQTSPESLTFKPDLKALPSNLT